MTVVLTIPLNRKVITMAAKITFGLWLERMLAKHHISQRELAAALEFSPSYVSTLAGDKPNSATGQPITPSRGRVIKIARFLGESVDEALDCAGYRPNKPDEESVKQLAASRFGLLFEKYDSLSNADKQFVDKFLEMLEAELNRRLPPSGTARKIKGGKG